MTPADCPSSPLDCSQASMWEAIGAIVMGRTLFGLVDGSRVEGSNEST
ncbi:hypothetical protein ABZ914_16050 [Spirillospora sp. NPDC046719]